MKSFNNFSYGKYPSAAEATLHQAPAQAGGQGINKTADKHLKCLSLMDFYISRS